MAASNGSNGHEHPGENSGFDFGGASELGKLTQPPTFANVQEERKYLLEKLAAALRIFAHLGFDHHVAGHLTVRDPENPHHFWVNPFGLAFRLITVSDLILVDQTGKVIGGGKEGRRIVNLAGFQIHSAIHKARPDVQAICHSHSMYGKAFSALGKELAITTQDSCAFHNDIALLANFGGVVIKGSEGSVIAETLQSKKAIILQNHGILTVGTTIDSAVAWFILLEAQCQVQLLADAAGKTVEIDEPQAVFTAKEVGSERAGFFAASPYFQVIEALQGHEYKK
ncbi:class II aldolase/adducin domain-containing protein [Meredithblackwellia eburnea MCA 4105]